MIELVVGVTIIAVLVALLLPAAQQARSAARRLATINQVKQLVLASHNHHDAHRRFPGFDAETGWSWSYELLPFLEESSLHSGLNRDTAWDCEQNLRISGSPSSFSTADAGADTQSTVTSRDTGNPVTIGATHFVMNGWLICKTMPPDTDRLVLLQRSPFGAAWSSAPEALEFQRVPQKNDPVIIGYVSGSVETVSNGDSLRFRSR